jgi:hypothetical protein
MKQHLISKYMTEERPLGKVPETATLTACYPSYIAASVKAKSMLVLH